MNILSLYIAILNKLYIYNWYAKKVGIYASHLGFFPIFATALHRKSAVLVFNLTHK